MKKLLQRFIALFRRPRKPDVAALPADVLAQVARESAFLRAQHGVEVQELAPGEEPGKPRAADPGVEQLLSTKSPGGA